MEEANGAASALHALGVQHIGERKIDEGILCLERAVQSGAARPGWWHNLAAAYAIAGRWEQMYATAICGLSRFPAHRQLSIDAARADVERGCASQAIARLRTLREGKDGGTAESLLVEARALRAIGQRHAAIDLLESCTRRYPKSRVAHLLLGSLYRGHPCDTGRAAEHLEAAANLHSDRFAPEWADVAMAQWEAGHLDRFLNTGRRLIHNGSASRKLHSFWLCGLLHQDEVTGAQLRQACEEWAARHAAPHETAVTAHTRRWDPAKRLRIGYIGADLCASPSCHFLPHLFRYADPAHSESFVYDLSGRCDHASLEAESLAGHWRRCANQPDEAIVKTILDDQLDILIETTSHFGGGRVWLHQQKLAPLVLVLPNCPSTTGMRQFDAILTDRWVCPPGTEEQYTEPVVRIDSGYLAYTPPACAPPISPLPMLRNGYVTFGLFQRLPKVSARSLDLCALALQRFPGSRLLIHNTSPDLEQRGCRTREYFELAMANRGIPAGRLEFRGSARLSAHLELIANCDIAIDTVPYNGQTTSCECLWMGVPVVTLLGGHHVARIGHWVLDRAGYPEWCAQDMQQYRQILDGLLADPQRLAQIRAEMRDRVATSLLTDGRRVAADTEKVCRELWTQLCHNR